MNISRKQVDDLNAVVTIEIDSTDYSDKVNKVLQDYRRTAKIPGFRPGKVPMGIVKRQYERAITIDEINRMLQNQIFEYIQEEKLDILGNPLPVPKNDIDWDNIQKLSFDFELGLTPKFEIPEGNKVKVPYYKIKVDKAAIDKEVEAITRRYGKMSEPGKIGTEDILYGTFRQIDGKGNIVEGGFEKDARFVVKELKSVRKQEEAMALKPEAVIDIDPKKDFASDFNVEGSLQTTAADLKNMKGLRFTFRNAYHIEPAELNEELFGKVLGPGAAATEGEFRDKLKAEMEKVYAGESDNLFLNTVSDTLMEKIKLDLPAAFLKKWMQTSGEEPVSAEEVESQWETTAKGLKWQLIENKIVKDHHLHVHKEELESFAENYVRDRMNTMGQLQMPDDQIRSIAQSLVNDPEQAQGMNDQVLNSKMIAYFKENLKVDENTVSYADFSKLANERK